MIEVLGMHVGGARSKIKAGNWGVAENSSLSCVHSCQKVIMLVPISLEPSLGRFYAMIVWEN